MSRSCKTVGFSLGKCRVELNVWFCAAAAVLLLYDTEGTVGWCFFAAALHELGHMGAMITLGYVPCVLRLTAFGARLRYDGSVVKKYGSDIIVSLSGPIVNLAACLLLFSMGELIFREAERTLRLSAGAQLALGVFNLLPIEPLDGGKALGAVLRKHISYERAEMLMDILAVVFLIPLGAAGLLVLLRSAGNYSLLALSIYLTALFVLKK